MMDIDWKKSLFQILINITVFTGLSAFTALLFVVGMFLTNNNLTTNYLLSLIIAGVAGGFWGFALDQISRTWETEMNKLKTQSYYSLVKKWGSYLMLIICLMIVLGIMMAHFGMISQ
jgi:hypothetical protein